MFEIRIVKTGIPAKVEVYHLSRPSTSGLVEYCEEDGFSMGSSYTDGEKSVFDVLFSLWDGEKSVFDVLFSLWVDIMIAGHL